MRNLIFTKVSTMNQEATISEAIPTQLKNSLTITLIVSVLTTALVGSGVLAYEKHQQSLAAQDLQVQIDALNHQISVAKITTATSSTPDPTNDWKTYLDSTYNLSFKYPSTWGLANGQVLTEGSGGWWEQGQTEIQFGTDQSSVTIDLTSFSTYDASVYDSTSSKADLQILKDTFAARKVISSNAPWLPLRNAQIAYHNTPHYIQSSDGKWRGEYYFAKITQEIIPTSPPYQLNEVLLVLTDGTKNVVQLEGKVANGGSTPLPTRTVEDTCYDSKNTIVSCSLVSLVQTDFTAYYQYFANTIHE